MTVEDGADVSFSSLRFGEVVGSGGQGEVVALPGTDILCKTYKDPSAVNDKALSTLAAFRQRLPSSERSFLDSVASWPLCRVTNRGRGVGFLMRRAPSVLWWRTPQGRTRLLELQYLIRAPKAAFRTVPQPTPSERRALALACVRTVDWFHRRGVVLGDISQANVLWGLESEPHVHLLDCDSFRPIGGATVLPATDTPDWNDPLTPSSRHDFDSDAYKTALLVARIITQEAYLVPGQRLDPVPGCLDERQETTVRRLFAEAAGARRLRPVLSEWLHALGDDAGALEQPARVTEDLVGAVQMDITDGSHNPCPGPIGPAGQSDLAGTASPPGGTSLASGIRDRKPINLRVSGR